MPSGEKKSLLILDGQGGGMGRKIAERLLAEKLELEILVVGANVAATSNMMKAGVSVGATGENAWVYNCKRADIIAGPLGIMLPHSMHGEISPQMAMAAAGSEAVKIVLPMAHHEHHIRVVGLGDKGLAALLEELAAQVKAAACGEGDSAFAGALC